MDRVNLIPVSEREARAARRRARKWVIALFCTFPLMMGSFLFCMYQAGVADDAAAENQQVIQSIQASRAVLKELRSQVRHWDSRIRRARRMRDKRRWSALVTRLVDAIPTGVWLTSLASQPAAPGGMGGVRVDMGETKDGKKVKEFDVEAPRGLVVKGGCVDPAAPLRFVAALKQSGMFASIGHEHVQQSGGSADGTFQFEIHCNW